MYVYTKHTNIHTHHRFTDQIGSLVPTEQQHALLLDISEKVHLPAECKVRHVCMYVYMDGFVCVCVCLCMCICMCVCMYVCMYVYMYVYVSKYVCMYVCAFAYRVQG
jgi:hypothetical protein